MSTRAADWMIANLSRIAKAQEKQTRPLRRRRSIPPGEQVRRYQAGAERWRLEAGHVTPEQWQQYEQAMQKRLSEV